MRLSNSNFGTSTFKCGKNASQNHKIEFPLFLNSKQSVCYDCDEQILPLYTASLHTDLALREKRKNLIKKKYTHKTNF